MSIVGVHIGKIRNNVVLSGGLRILETTDRISAFDYVFPFSIPNKGKILQALSILFFEKTKHILENHIVGVLDATHILTRQVAVFPVEIIVRQYLSGSLWRLYAAEGPQGVAQKYGVSLPAGMTSNQRLPQPIITPSTKALCGHDEPISLQEAASLVGKEHWQNIEQKAFALFACGQEEARKHDLILVDTKYEMGLYEGRLMLADEIHTPDSSRYWHLEDEQSPQPRQISKEFLREELMSILGDPAHFPQNPALHPDLQEGAPLAVTLAQRVSQRYEELFSKMTGSADVDSFWASKSTLEWPLAKEAFQEAVRAHAFPATVLVVGNGGRDYVLASQIAQLSEVRAVYCAAGNRDWSFHKYAPCPVTTPAEVARFAKENRIELVIAGPEDPIAKGLQDACHKQGIPVLAPSLACASLETSKILCKQLFEEARVRTPQGWIYRWSELRPMLVEKDLPIPCVIKYDSLAAGKGVFVMENFQSCHEVLATIDEQLPLWQKLLEEIQTPVYSKQLNEPCFLIEELIVGEECSVIALCNNEHFRLLPIAKDYKRCYDNQKGPNTGGMGSKAPVKMPDHLVAQFQQAFASTLRTLASRGTPYYGFLFGGFMIDKERNAYLLEFNCRLGDPETQVILPALGRDFYAELSLTAQQKPFYYPDRSGTFFESDALHRLFVVGAAPEYPLRNPPCRQLKIPSNLPEGVTFVPSALEVHGKTSGGRAFGMLAAAPNLAQARERAYAAMSETQFSNDNGSTTKPHYRTDIGE